MPFGCVPIRQSGHQLASASLAMLRLQCLSAVCLSGRSGMHPPEVSMRRLSPMPFGCVPIRQGIYAHAVDARSSGSPMPFGCVPIRQQSRPDGGGHQPQQSPMPFGCVPIRQTGTQPKTQSLTHEVSNAFRLCAYPAAMIKNLTPHSITIGLQCLSAVCLSGSGGAWPCHHGNRNHGLQCLSAVCLSGRKPKVE